MEIWKDVTEYEGIYTVSNYGRVRSLMSNKILQPISNGVGYFKVELWKNNKGKRVYIHRLVAEHFVNNQYNKIEVNHKDGNPSNNYADNLEWVTSSENTKHAIYRGKLNAWGNKSKPIEAINITSGNVLHFATISEAEKAIGSKHITDVLKGKRNHCKGYTFKYLEGGDACANFEYITAK